MAIYAQKLQHLVDQAKTLEPIRVAVVDAAQDVVIETLREAQALGFIEPRLIGASSPATSLPRTWNTLLELLPPGSPWGWPCRWC